MAQVNLGHVVGPGVPTGGSANQILVKNGSTNFDTSWKDAGTIPSIANVQDGLAIVANGNTHAAIASGQFVYVKNHGSLADGLYRATAAIGTNATLSTSNLTADSTGGLNALKADVDTLNSNLTPVEYALTESLILRKFGKVCVLSGFHIWSSTQSGEATIGTLPAGYKPKHAVRTLANIGTNAWSYNRTAYFTVSESTGNVKVVPADSTGYTAVYVNCSWVLF